MYQQVMSRHPLTETYRYEARSPSGFIQQLAVSYVTNGYFLYVTGVIPSHKDPARTDEKLIDRYRLSVSKWTRYRESLRGAAKVQYLRYGHFFVLLATLGGHQFRDEEASQMRDIRRVPLKAFGYSVGHSQRGVQVRIERETLRGLRKRFTQMALTSRSETIEQTFESLPFEPYRPVRKALLGLVRHVNRIRRRAGYDPVSAEGMRRFRRIESPFVLRDAVEGVDADGDGSH